MSNIVTVYENLAAMDVTVGGITPEVLGLEDLPLTLETPPARILDLSYGPDGGAFDFLAHSGDTATVQWSITDLLLWEEQGQNRGPMAIAESLITYCGAYCEAVRDTRPIVPGGQCEIHALSLTPSYNIEWPRGAGRFYYGVEVKLHVTEVLSGQ